MTVEAAHCFDLLAADLRWNTFTKQERQIVDDFARRWNIKPGQQVLEPGCGTGRLTEVLAMLTGPSGSVVAFDASADLIRVATQRQLPAHVRLHTARAETFVVQSGVFDHIVCFNVFPHLVPHALTAERLVTALQPGGVLWIAHACSRTFVNEVHRAEPCMHDHLLPEPAELDRLLRAVGLHEVEIEDEADRFLARAIRPVTKSNNAV
jgi:ubiquinone/menaquinone biosynthesis C-methylase UbiE